MKRVRKGEYGYLSYEKKVTILRTIIYFGISIALYVVGYVTTKTNKNWLTIVAILGMLPASKSAVNMIMFLKARDCSEMLHEKLEAVKKSAGEELHIFYDLYFTSYQKNYPISAIVVKGNCICGVTEYGKCDVAAAEKHLEEMLSKNGIKGYSVKIFNQTEKLVDRTSQLIELQSEENVYFSELTALLCDISL